MKQIDLAIHNYHDTHGSMPALNGTVTFGNGDTAHNYSALFHLLPFYEGQARYSAVVTNQTKIDAKGNNDRLRGSIPAIICPSDPEGGQPGQAPTSTTDSTPTRATRNNVVVCVGDYMAQNHTPAHAATRAFGSNRAPFSRTKDSITDTNPYFNVWKSFAAVSDGLSNTMGVSEAVTSDSGTASLNPKTFVVVVNLSPSASPPYSSPPSTCRDTALSATDRTQLDSTTVNNTPANASRGHVFSHGYVGRTGFCAALPPNSPSCSNRNQPDLFKGWGAYSATSYHVGGINIGLLDGSIRFISEGIQCGNLTVSVTGSGESPYGVWGGLATINARESLPGL